MQGQSKPNNSDRAGNGSDDSGEQAERDAAEQNEVASSMARSLLKRIDNAIRNAGQDAGSSQDGDSCGDTGQFWSGVDDRTRTRTVARAH